MIPFDVQRCLVQNYQLNKIFQYFFKFSTPNWLLELLYSSLNLSFVEC